MTTNSEKIVQLDSYRKEGKASPKIVRISSEMDGLEALYTNDLSSERLFTIKILFWALLDNGSVCAIIPWLKDIITTNELNNPHTGQWQGYYDQKLDRIMFKPPEFKVKELELGHHYFDLDPSSSAKPTYQELTNQELTNQELTSQEIGKPKSAGHHKNLQELPDHLGTHAAFKHKEQKGFYLKPVISWRLTADGKLLAMTIQQENSPITPLPGSDELVPAIEDSNFRYYFQHGIASRIKREDPDTITAVSLLIDLV
ncbi:hypothetical protein [Litoribacillus peritrichatus]|uniref:Uncharacterized protein n=1 Tax=Litoribacillus peritrichatus TaxID=718191 RepID=A0ABP7N575_9GAMM